MPHSFQRRKHANFIERCGGLGHQVDADTQLLDRRRLLEYLKSAVANPPIPAPTMIAFMFRPSSLHLPLAVWALHHLAVPQTL